MSTRYLSTEIVKNGKILAFLATSYNSGFVSKHVQAVVETAFEELSPYIHDKIQTLYIRDIPELIIDGEYPLGHCYNRHEAMIAIKTWAVGSLNMYYLTAAIYHELHHMARWQNAGYGSTLGEAIVSEGFATYYEELKSGWTPPWAEAEVTKSMRRAAVREWDNMGYDHNAWFYEGKRGRWVGYAIGSELAKSVYNVPGFDLKHSLAVDASRYKDVVQDSNRILI